MKCPYTVEVFMVNRRERPECAPPDKAKALVEYIKRNLPVWERKFKQYKTYQDEHIDTLRCLSVISTYLSSSVPKVPSWLFYKFWNYYTMGELIRRELAERIRTYKKPMSVNTYKYLKKQVQALRNYLQRLEQGVNLMSSILKRYGNVPSRYYPEYCVRKGKGWTLRHSALYKILRRRGYYSTRASSPSLLRCVTPYGRRRGRNTRRIRRCSAFFVFRKTPSKHLQVVDKNKILKREKVVTKPKFKVREALIQKREVAQAQVLVRKKENQGDSMQKYLPYAVGAGLALILLMNRG